MTRPTSGTLVDAAIALAVLGGSLLMLSHSGVPDWVSEDPGFGAHRRAFADVSDLDTLGVLLAVCASAPLVAWRRSPVAALAAIGVASGLLAGLGYRLWLPLGAAVAVFLVAASRSDDEPWSRRLTAVAVAAFAGYLGAAWIEQGTFPDAKVLHGGLAFAVAWFAGDRTRLRREHIAELKERAVRAEREAERERRLAVAEERARIARDLHDAAGHAINVITVRAGAARTRQDPERSQAALELIEDLARQTAAEIDAIVNTLRDRTDGDGVPHSPLGLASLDVLVADNAAAGLTVSVTDHGDPRPLDGAADQAAYRILQEALTNAARHGTGSACVELTFGPSALELTVSNPVSAERVSRTNGGHGLIGMRERATLLGGTLEAQRVNGDFHIRAFLPYRAPRT